MIPARHRVLGALSSGRGHNQLEHFEDVESRQQRRLIHYSRVSVGIVFAVMAPHYLFIRDVFWEAEIVSLGFIIPMLLLAVALARRGRRAPAELALLTAFGGMPVFAFWVIGSSTGKPELVALYALGICSLMCIWCNATFGVRLWKPAVCYLLMSVNIIAMFSRMRGLSWRSVWCLALLVITAAVMALLSNAFTQRDERAFVAEGERMLSAIVAGRHDLWAFEIPTGMAEVLRATPKGPRRKTGLNVETYLSLLHPDDRQYVRDYLQECIELGESRAPCQYRSAPDERGECAWYEGIGKVVEYDLRGRPVTVFGMTNNITDQKYLTRQIEEQSEEIARATRAKSDFLATMSHEIRTPLNGILGMASLLGQLELTADQQQMVAVIQSSGGTLLQVLNDVLDFSKIEAGKLSLGRGPFEIRDVVEGAMRSVETLARSKSIGTAIHVAPEVSAWLTGDSVHLRKVLAHLLSNAVKFTSAGEVNLDISSRGPVDGGVQALRFLVRDTGSGMDEESQRRLYSPFTKVQGRSLTADSGTGLGLAISKRVVEAMGGSIGCESQLGSGTRMTVELSFPTCDGPRRQRGPGKTGPVRILVAEDNPVNQVVIQGLLKKLGYAASVVGDGRRAVEEVTNGRFDIVLMDCEMPLLDGLAATRLIRRLPGCEKLPVIALSAHGVEDQAAACAAAGMTDYLTKPLAVQDLREKLLRWI